MEQVSSLFYNLISSSTYLISSSTVTSAASQGWSFNWNPSCKYLKFVFLSFPVCSHLSPSHSFLVCFSCVKLSDTFTQENVRPTQWSQVVNLFVFLHVLSFINNLEWVIPQYAKLQLKSPRCTFAMSLFSVWRIWTMSTWIAYYTSILSFEIIQACFIRTSIQIQRDRLRFAALDEPASDLLELDLMLDGNTQPIIK